MKQYLIPYLISSHPGSRVEEELAVFLKSGFILDQGTGLYPTLERWLPVYYTELDPAYHETSLCAEDMNSEMQWH